jgi:hypothetical protein
MLEHFAVRRTQQPVAAEKHRFGPEIGQSVTAPAPDPDGTEALETDIKPLQKMQLGVRDQTISVYENGFPAAMF